LISIPTKDNTFFLEGDLTIPNISQIIGIIIFAHGSGSGRNSPRNQHTQRVLNNAGFATLLVDLLTPEEQDADIKAQTLSHKIPGLTLNKFNIMLLAKRLAIVAEWAVTYELTQNFNIGYFGASTGAAAAVEAAAMTTQIGKRISAIVSRGGRPDLAAVNSLRAVKAATMFIVGDKDSKVVIDLNKKAFKELRNAKEKKLAIIPDAGHLFEEPGCIEEVGRLSVDWFEKQFT
jgi:putative phosphoribosyl transferase